MIPGTCAMRTVRGTAEQGRIREVRRSVTLAHLGQFADLQFLAGTGDPGHRGVVANVHDQDLTHHFPGRIRIVLLPAFEVGPIAVAAADHEGPVADLDTVTLATAT